MPANRGPLAFASAAVAIAVAGALALGYLTRPTGHARFVPAANLAAISAHDTNGLTRQLETLGLLDAVKQGTLKSVPRIGLSSMPPSWQALGDSDKRKRLFIAAVLPLVLAANENIADDRARLLAMAERSSRLSSRERIWLAETARRYRTDPDDWKRLLRRVDEVPASLAVAQAAIESGWGTSRFARQGNALFGQWTWGGKGIKPKEQREDLGDYAIAAFDTPLQSVQAYILNLNSHPAYAELRQRRADMRTAGEELSGHRLAETLTSYSERGEEYVKSLHTIMRVNKLDATDEAVLADGPVWQVYPARN